VITRFSWASPPAAPAPLEACIVVTKPVDQQRASSFRR